jgi:hypothetical protein
MKTIKRLEPFIFFFALTPFSLPVFSQTQDIMYQPMALPPQCQLNISNFNAELAQDLAGSGFVNGWGPSRNRLILGNFHPNLQVCMNYTPAGKAWQRARINSAADFWIARKLNYCHHYLPDYPTPLDGRHAGKKQGGYCNPAVNLDSRSPYYQQQIRWNYTGKAQETTKDWQNEAMWFGLDCSNYTAFLYNFAFGTVFSSQIGFQAGQGGSAGYLSPNEQTMEAIIDKPRAAGKLVCWDNTPEVNHSCDDHGQYISAIDQQGQFLPAGSITAAKLAALPLHPGDLLFIAGSENRVVHVVMWTGKQVGYGVHDVPPEQIAPNASCPNDWMPKLGDWVITDSHYQGPDYRVLTSCYYLNHLWGVRRVIGVE